MKEIIEGFKQGIDAGFEKIAEEYNLEASDKAEFIEKVAEDFEMRILSEGLDKEAGFMGTAVEAAKGYAGAAKGAVVSGFSGEVGKNFAGVPAQLTASAIAAMGVLAARKIGMNMQQKDNKIGYKMALSKAIESSEILSADPIKAKRMGDSIFAFAPTVAQDANLLANILDNSVHGATIDLQTVRAVTELEEKLSKLRNV